MLPATVAALRPLRAQLKEISAKLEELAGVEREDDPEGSRDSYEILAGLSVASEYLSYELDGLLK